MIKPKVGILTNFGGSDSAFSLVNVVATQLRMLIDGGYNPVLFVCPSFTGEGIWEDGRIEVRKTVPVDAKAVDIATCLRGMISDIDIMLCHDIVFLSPQNDEWAKAVRFMTKDFPNIRWLHWQHSRGDHAPIEPVKNSEFCYPNKGDLPHVANINSTTIERVHYVPHPMDFAYLGWPSLAIKIAEDFQFPFVDVSMIYPSRLDRQKQIEKAIRVFAGIKRAGRTVCLLVADAYATGERFKAYKKDCYALAKELGLSDKEFNFLGEVYEECTYSTPRPVVKALFEMSNLFLQVSNSETSSLVVMEAVLAGNLIVLNTDFSPIHHLYKKALSLPFASVTNPDTKYWRTIRTVDGTETKIEDPQLFFDDQARITILPILDSQLTIQLKRQQLRERWPSRIFSEYLEPLLLKDWKPEIVVPMCEGDPEVTAIICTIDNLEMLKRQIPVLMKEVGQIIVVNNGSVDGTKEWLDENLVVGLFPIHRENHGAGPGRNAGLALWDKNPTPYTLMLDGGILPPKGGVAPMKRYLERHPEVTSCSPEIATCYTTDEKEATFIYREPEIKDEWCFPQMMLSGTAYGLYKAEKWKIRFNEEGPYGEPGWGVDDNDMADRWRKAGLIHHDFSSLAGMKLFRRSSGSHTRLFKETGIYPTQYGSVYEKRVVKLWQDYPEYQAMPIKLSVVILGWNEYPMIARCVKAVHDDLHDKVPHEVIVVDNGSTDETQNWINNQRYRQYWGDTTIDTKTGEIIKRTPENESTWTGNFIPLVFEKNMGIGYATNRGFEKARGEYVFYLQGDILPTKGSILALYNYLVEHPDMDFLCVNAWVAQKDTEDVVMPDLHTIVPQGLGNYAYAYSVFKRQIIDAGCRYAEEGPFEGAGAGYEECEFANQMASKGFKAYMFNAPFYFHDLRRGRRSGIEDDTKRQEKETERRKWLTVRWNKSPFDITHYHEQPPERHIRRVAVMANHVEGHYAPAEFMAMSLNGKFGCWVDHFNSLDNPFDAGNSNRLNLARIKGYYDDFLFIDDGDLKYWECPEWAHPSHYWAIDMYVPSGYPYGSPDDYVRKGKTFDHFYTGSVGAVEYCKQNGLNAELLSFAGSEIMHKPYPEEKIYDFVACWNNVGDRIEYANKALERFPQSFVGYKEGEEYAKTISKARCAINLCRINEYNMRVPEVMLCGVPLVTDRTSNLNLYFKEGEHYLGHSSLDEILEKIQWVKDHPAEAQAMADRAREVALKGHTYYQRILQIFGKDVW